MSAVTDAAELEAAAAEHELAPEEAERLAELAKEGAPLAEALEQVLADREPEQPPPAVGPPEAEEPTEKQWAAVARENERHERKVHEIMGAFVDGFEACGTCSGAGIVPPGPPPPTPKPHENFRVCETCEGFGLVLTGSIAPGHETRACPSCAGRGYEELLEADGRPVSISGPDAPPSIVTPPPPSHELPPGAQLEEAGGRRFGTPAWMGDPNIGR
jgi:hypothetical protein